MLKAIKIISRLFLILAALHAGAQTAINLMPYPQALQTGAGKLRVTSQFAISLSGVAEDATIEAASNRFLRKLNARTLAYFEQERVVLNKQATTSTLAIEVKKKGRVATRSR